MDGRMNDAPSTSVASPHGTDLLLEDFFVSLGRAAPPPPPGPRSPVNGEMSVEGLNKSRPAPDTL